MHRDIHLGKLSMASPIFVVGRNRSGTKWLSNCIANHPDIACVQRPGAGGILETNLLWYMPRLFGNLSIDENYWGFLACYAQTNFFRLTGLDTRVLYACRFTNYCRFFRYIMDLYAQKEEKKYWLQKANSLHAEQIYSEFPDAKIIIIQRGIKDNIRSTVGLRVLKGDPQPIGGIMRDMFGYYYCHKTENRIRKHPNVFITRYELLKERREETLRKICDFIGTRFDEGMLSDKYEKNTSYKNGVSKHDVLSQTELVAIKLLSPVFKLLPWHLYNVIWRLAHQIPGVRHEDKRFISLTFSLLTEETHPSAGAAQFNSGEEQERIRVK